MRMRWLAVLGLIGCTAVITGCGPKRSASSGADASSGTTAAAQMADSLVVGLWHAELGATSGPARTRELTLTGERVATLTSDPRNGKAPVVESGHWEARDADIVRVTLDHRDGQVVDRTDLFLRVSAGHLALVDQDTLRWGSEPVGLARGAAPIRAATP